MESRKEEGSSQDLNEQFLPIIYRGVEVYYAKVCPTKLWLFMHDLGMEHESDLVFLGKILHEKAYPGKAKEVLLSERIKIDFITRKEGVVIHEVKNSDKLKHADEMQVLYYIYYLKSVGVENVYGVIHYPRLRKKVLIKPNKEDFKKLMDVLEFVDRIRRMSTPPKPVWKKICGGCSYRSLCWAD